MNHPDNAVFIPGEPATFATRMEKPWKETLSAYLRHVPNAGNMVDLTFHLSPNRFSSRGYDLDNLCEPVFSVLASGLGWFGGRQAGIRGWRAVKAVSDTPGLSLRQVHEIPTMHSLSHILFDQVYRGALPRSARSPEIPAWLQSFSGLPAPRGLLGLAMDFTNTGRSIASIPVGLVKHAVDCLYPIIGGRVGGPDDHLIGEMAARRLEDVSGTPSIRFVLWSMGNPEA